jgi:hypothetical protein
MCQLYSLVASTLKSEKNGSSSESSGDESEKDKSVGAGELIDTYRLTKERSITKRVECHLRDTMNIKRKLCSPRVLFGVQSD